MTERKQQKSAPEAEAKTEEPINKPDLLAFVAMMIEKGIEHAQIVEASSNSVIDDIEKTLTKAKKDGVDTVILAAGRTAYEMSLQKELKKRKAKAAVVIVD